jgi:hypothetical protein
VSAGRVTASRYRTVITSKVKESLPNPRWLTSAAHAVLLMGHGEASGPVIRTAQTLGSREAIIGIRESSPILSDGGCSIGRYSELARLGRWDTGARYTEPGSLRIGCR